MEILQQVVNGLTQGAIYALIALGYTMVYGVLRLINFAHGDVYMLGAFAGFYTAARIGLTERLENNPTLYDARHWLLTAVVFVAAMLACALFGMLMERFAYRPLRQAPRLASLITAIGISMLIEYSAQAIFTPDPKAFPPLIPEKNLYAVGDTFNFTYTQGTIIAVALSLMLGLQFIVSKTRIGRAMRAVALDRDAASLMGINTDRVISFTFALGSALAAAGGVLNSVYTPKIEPLMGLLVGLKAFVAAVLGGIGSIPGAVLGGFLMAGAETTVVARGYSSYRDAIAFAILIIVLLVRPAGLLGRHVAEKV